MVHVQIHHPNLKLYDCHSVHVLLIISPTGFVSNGEFNYLRTRGYTRPLTIFDVWASVRKVYSHLGLKTLAAMLTPYSMPVR